MINIKKEIEKELKKKIKGIDLPKISGLIKLNDKIDIPGIKQTADNLMTETIESIKQNTSVVYGEAQGIYNQIQESSKTIPQTLKNIAVEMEAKLKEGIDLTGIKQTADSLMTETIENIKQNASVVYGEAQGIYNQIQESSKTIPQTLKNVAVDMEAKLKEGIDLTGIKQTVDSLMTETIENIKQNASVVYGEAQGIYNQIQESSKTIPQTLKNVAVDMEAKLKEGIDLTGIKQTADNLMTKTKDNAKQAASEIYNTAVNLKDEAVNSAQNMFNEVKQIASEIPNMVDSSIESIKETISAVDLGSIVEEAKVMIEKTFNNISSTAMDCYNNIKAQITDLPGLLNSILQNLLSDVLSEITGIINESLSSVLEPIIDVFSNILEPIQNLLKTLTDLFHNLTFFNDIMEVVSEITSSFSEALKFLTDGIITPLKNVVQSFTNSVASAINSVLGLFGIKIKRANPKDVEKQIKEATANLEGVNEEISRVKASYTAQRKLVEDLYSSNIKSLQELRKVGAITIDDYMSRVEEAEHEYKNKLDNLIKEEKDQLKCLVDIREILSKGLSVKIQGGSAKSSKGGGIIGGILDGVVGGIGGIVSGIGSIFSDRRLKENVRQVGSIGSLPVYSYNYTRKAQNHLGLPSIIQMGLMAQDVKKSFPEAVTSKNGYLQIDYSKRRQVKNISMHSPLSASYAKRPYNSSPDHMSTVSNIVNVTVQGSVISERELTDKIAVNMQKNILRGYTNKGII